MRLGTARTILVCSRGFAMCVSPLLCRMSGAKFLNFLKSGGNKRPFEVREGPNQMIYVIARLNVKPDMKTALLAAAKDCIAATRQEKGCISYELFESVIDPDKLVFVEEWESADYLPAHSKSDHMRAFGRVAVGCLASPAQIEVITPEKVERR